MRIRDVMTEPVETIPPSMAFGPGRRVDARASGSPAPRAALHYRVPHEKQHRGRSW
jgi:hypothetical protein